MGRTTSTSQPDRDLEAISQRILLAGPSFTTMQFRLGVHSKKDLVAIATGFAEQVGKQRPDRLCHRAKDAMICWMCENAPDFPAGFPCVPIYVAGPPLRPPPLQVKKTQQVAGDGLQTESEPDLFLNWDGDFAEDSDPW
jgi:hypothetical protein